MKILAHALSGIGKEVSFKVYIPFSIKNPTSASDSSLDYIFHVL